MFFTIEIYKTDRRTKEGDRLIGKYDYDRKDKEALAREISQLYPTSKGYHFNVVETYVTSTNLLSGEEFVERYDTPSCCSPSSETYWSM